MKECISSTSFSVLVNGSLTPLFKASKGLRQGDPLSPFLFTIVAEALRALLLNSKDKGLISGFEACSGGEVLSPSVC